MWEVIILRSIIRIIILVPIIFILMIYSYSIRDENEPLKDNLSSPKVDYTIEEDTSTITKRPDEGLSKYIGKSGKEFTEVYGEPQRKEPSAYGYDWWIYKSFSGTYMQVGVEYGKIVTIYALGNQLNVAPFRIGQTIEEIFRTTFLEAEILVTIEDGAYRFELSEEDLNIRPLVQLGDIYAQLSLNKYTSSLSSIRFFDKETLIAMRPYELVYRGELIEPPEISDIEWNEIEIGIEQQIFDITNVIRDRNQLKRLQWNQELGRIAYEHSKDMFENDYFSHDSPDFGTLTNRLESNDISYKNAGENIAAEYMDGPAAIEGWLNSEAHQKDLLAENFTHLGVGVYRKNYTQNFIEIED